MFTTRKLLPIAVLGTIALLTVYLVLDGAMGKASAQREEDEAALQNLLKLEGALPADVAGAGSRDIARIQKSADRFSWQEFVALNWPARTGQRGEQDREKQLSDAGPRVWETWKETHEVYLPEGDAPPAWEAPQPLPAGLQGNTPPSLTTHLLTSVLQATQAEDAHPATLTDQHGRLVRYETRMNRVLFDHICQNHLYDSRKQAGQEGVFLPFGSIIIKASWRELEPKEDGRFLTADAWVADLKDGKPGKWRRKRMGLVGLHIVQKTPSAPEWVWTTFEHVDNLAGPHPSFHNPARANLPANQQTRPGTPNQVTRVLLPMEEAGGPSHANDLCELNRAMQKALAEAHSVLQYYELVDTQWPLQPAWKASYSPRDTARPQPTFVSNTTLETFTQETSSCMGCHSTARTARPDRAVPADFTFTLSNAQPVLKDPARIAPPEKPVTAWDKRNWRAILRGRELLQHTYELLPQYVTAKYHCESCHLDGAGNPDAPWWVGMLAKYDFPATDKLQARINRCFKRSMNGTPISSAHGEEEIARKAPEMHAFITYMKWMDEQYAARTSTPPKNGLPAMPRIAGSAERGREIFLQKCATCHGKDGQGRYGSDTYYRPALWGPHACNRGASMDDFPKLVPFLKQNMPYLSGGLLTNLEAWDVATYIIAQQHPDFQNDESGTS